MITLAEAKSVVAAAEAEARENGWSMAIEGGELLLADGKVVGALGVSGGSAPQDGVVARAAAATLK